MKNLIVFASCVIFAVNVSADSIFAGSETFVVTNSASGVILVTNAPTSGGSPLAWYPAGILANFRDSPTGAVLIVSHVRSGVVNPLVSTNAISVTNVLYTSGTGVTASIVWDPDGHYPVIPTNDWLRITTSSTNCEIILNKAVER